MNRIHQSATIGMFVIILSGIYLGCGEGDNPGTLEIHLKNLGTVSGQNLTVVVRANGQERPHSELREVISVALEPGVANVGIDFKNGDEIKFSGPHEVPIEGNRIARIEVDLRQVFPPTPTLLIPVEGCFEDAELPYQIIVDTGIELLDPDGKRIKVIGGNGFVDLGLLQIKDCESQELRTQLTMSSEYIGRDISVWEFDEQKGGYTGDVGGQAIIYLDRREDRNVIFTGVYITDPPGNVLARIDPENGRITEFKVEYYLKMTGEGIYTGYVLEGRVTVEQVGGLLLVDVSGKIKRVF